MNSSNVDTLGEDLVLLSIRPGKGSLATARSIDYGLMASELIRLAARGRISIEAGHLVVRDAALVGDAELDAALDSLAQAKQPLSARKWVKGRRGGLASAYLSRLVTSGALRTESRRFLGTRWFIADPARAADARARFDAIVFSSGQVDFAQAAFGGLARAIGLDTFLYPLNPGKTGRSNRSVQERLTQIAKEQWTVEALTGPAASDPDAAAVQASIRAVVQAATDAASWAAPSYQEA